MISKLEETVEETLTGLSSAASKTERLQWEMSASRSAGLLLGNWLSRDPSEFAKSKTHDYILAMSDRDKYQVSTRRGRGREHDGKTCRWK